MNILKKLAKKIADALFPSNVTCMGCNDELKTKEQREKRVCENCEIELMYIGDKVQEIENSHLHIDEFVTVYAYDGLAKNLVIGFKDGNKPYLGKCIAAYLYQEFKKKVLEIDYISYVPSAPKKKKDRGYDHMKIVADSFSELSGKSVIDVLSRKEQVTDQTQTKDRYANIKGQFYFVNNINIKNKTILLLDDVVTTGATISECSKRLKENKAKKVILLTFTEAKSFSDYKRTTPKRMKDRA